MTTIFGFLRYISCDVQGLFYISQVRQFYRQRNVNMTFATVFRRNSMDLQYECYQCHDELLINSIPLIEESHYFGYPSPWLVSFRRSVPVAICNAPPWIITGELVEMWPSVRSARKRSSSKPIRIDAGCFKNISCIVLWN